MESLLQAKEKYCESLMEKRNVVGVGLGCKMRSQQATDRDAVVVLVREKLPLDQLHQMDVVPTELGAGIRTDVIEAGDIRALYLNDDEVAFRHGRQRPAPGGVSVGHYQVTAGTLGAWVSDCATGEPLVLSNNHVLANISNGSDGRAEAGDPVLQPGAYDGGNRRSDALAQLERFVPIYLQVSEPTCPQARGVEKGFNSLMRVFAPGYEVKFHRLSGRTNLVDAAVARATDPDYVSDEIAQLGSLQGVGEPRVGMKVKKSGRSSGVSSGEITVIDATIRVDMGDVGEAVFDEQIVTEAMAQPGDSGSVLLDEQNRAVGLLSAGSSKSSISGRMDHVFDLLDIKV